MSQLRRYNRDIKREFGLCPGDALGRAHFRLEMTDQIEKRIGKVSKFTEGGLWLGEETGVHSVPKYNFSGHYEKPKWALERLMFAPLPEVPDTLGGSYEPVHVFPHINGLCQLPPYRAIQLTIYLLLYGPRKTMSDYMSEDEEQFKKEVEMGELILEDQRSYMQGCIQDGVAITMPKNYERESPLLIKGVKK